MADRLRLLPSSVNGRGAAAATITFADPARTMLECAPSIRMDVITALSELGLKLRPSAGELKRAYLKAVKLHPPERDPDGFVLVREAYEVLQAATVAPLFVEQYEPRSRVQQDLPEDVGDGATDTASNDGAVANSTGTDEFSLPDENASAEELANRAVALLISDSVTFETIHWILSRLDSAAGPDAVVEALRRAESNDSRRALAMLLEGSPDGVDERMLARARRSTDERTRIAAIRYYWQQDDAPETAKLLTRVYESSTAEPIAIPAPSFCVDVVLSCNALGKHVAATALLSAFENWQKRHSNSKALQGNVAARWQLARELRSLKRCITPELRQAIAEAILRDNASLLAEPASSRRNVLTERELEQFQLFAPALYAFARPHLFRAVKPGAAAAYRARHNPTWFVAPVVGALLMMANALSGSWSKNSGATVPDRNAFELPQGAKENRGANAPSNLSPVPEVPDPAGLTEAAKQIGYLSLAARATTIWSKIKDGECKASPRELDEFLRSAQAAAQTSPQLQQPVDAFAGYLSSACNSQLSSNAR